MCNSSPFPIWLGPFFLIYFLVELRFVYQAGPPCDLTWEDTLNELHTRWQDSWADIWTISSVLLVMWWGQDSPGIWSQLFITTHHHVLPTGGRPCCLGKRCVLDPTFFFNIPRSNAGSLQVNTWILKQVGLKLEFSVWYGIRHRRIPSPLFRQLVCHEWLKAPH